MPGMKTVKCSQQRIDRKWNTNKKSPLLICPLQWREFTVDHSLLISRLDPDDDYFTTRSPTVWIRDDDECQFTCPMKKKANYSSCHTYFCLFSLPLLTSIHLILLMQTTNTHLWFDFLDRRFEAYRERIVIFQSTRSIFSFIWPLQLYQQKLCRQS